MADNTHIEWTDATWNPITGCSVVSPGCTNCYAMKLAGTRLKHHPTRIGLTVDTKASQSGARTRSHPVWNGKVRFNDGVLTQPLKWKRPRMIFVCAHGDLFHPDVPDAWIDQVFAVMALAPQHTFQVLTKRPERMRTYLAARLEGDPWAEAADAVADLLELTEHPHVLEPRDMPLPNVWLGTSVEDQRRADERIPHLLQTPAAIRFLSAEPLLGPIDLRAVAADDTGETDALMGLTFCQGRDEPAEHHKLDWVIVGGESGNGARPMHPDWARSLRDQCAAAGVAFFFKQWGAWAEWPDAAFESEAAESLDVAGRYAYFQASSGAPMVHMRNDGKKAAGRLLDGIEHSGMPAR